MRKPQNWFSRRQDSADTMAHFLGNSPPAKNLHEGKIVLTLLGMGFIVNGQLTPNIR